ncbi:hypothetical protein YERSI8AC_220219 [Enterobacterales bacterium 8AC]|nr:hypothetical protein YERSI8AC_220219 [Enterobacterales bacterium 8AC]
MHNKKTYIDSIDTKPALTLSKCNPLLIRRHYELQQKSLVSRTDLLCHILAAGYR